MTPCTQCGSEHIRRNPSGVDVCLNCGALHCIHCGRKLVAHRKGYCVVLRCNEKCEQGERE